MTTIPKSAVAITNTVVIRSEDDTEFQELCCNKKATRFWVWGGKYIDLARGPQRSIKWEREIDRAEAIKIAEEMQARNEAEDARRAAEREADEAEELDEELDEEPADLNQMSLNV